MATSKEREALSAVVEAAAAAQAQQLAQLTDRLSSLVATSPDIRRLGEKLDQLMAGQAATNAWAEAIDGRLDKVNGKIAEHEKRIGATETQQAVGLHFCPVAEAIKEEVVAVKED